MSRMLVSILFGILIVMNAPAFSQENVYGEAWLEYEVDEGGNIWLYGSASITSTYGVSFWYDLRIDGWLTDDTFYNVLDIDSCGGNGSEFPTTDYDAPGQRGQSYYIYADIFTRSYFWDVPQVSWLDPFDFEEASTYTCPSHCFDCGWPDESCCNCNLTSQTQGAIFLRSCVCDEKEPPNVIWGEMIAISALVCQKIVPEAPPCTLTIASPINGQIYSLLGGDVRTATIPLRATSSCAGTATVTWTLDFSYKTSGNRGPWTGTRTTSSVLGQTSDLNVISIGGAVTLNAAATIQGQKVYNYAVAYVVGAAIADQQITDRLVSLYSGGARPRLLTGIASYESSYRQFADRLLYGSWARWPLESYDGGSHIGLMMVVPNMERAYDWYSNTQMGRDLFVDDKLASSASWVQQRQKDYPNLPALTGEQHEMNALVLYGPYASPTQHYYEPNAAGNAWIVNISVNLDGIQYADGVISCMK